MRNKEINNGPIIPFTTVISFFYLLTIITVLNDVRPGFSFEEEPQQEVITDASQSTASDAAVPGPNFDGDPYSSSCFFSHSPASFADFLFLQKLQLAKTNALAVKPLVAKQKGFYLPLRSGILPA